MGVLGTPAGRMEVGGIDAMCVLSEKYGGSGCARNIWRRVEVAGMDAM